MAKANSTITLQGTYGGITFVKSPTYGDHVRAARGTHKKVKLSPAFKKQSKKLVSANLPAQILKNAINPYREDFHYGQLWQDLVSMVNGVIQKGQAFDFSRLKPFDLHPKYPIHRLIQIHTTTTVDEDSSKLQVTLASDTPPIFDDSLHVDGYRLRVIVIFPDLKKQTARTDAVHSNIITLNEKIGPLGMEFSIPSAAKSFLICVRIDGFREGKLYDAFATTGMKVVEVGKV